MSSPHAPPTGPRRTRWRPSPRGMGWDRRRHGATWPGAWSTRCCCSTSAACCASTCAPPTTPRWPRKPGCWPGWPATPHAHNTTPRVRQKEGAGVAYHFRPLEGALAPAKQPVPGFILEPVENAEDLVQQVGDRAERTTAVEQVSNGTKQITEQAPALLGGDIQH